MGTPPPLASPASGALQALGRLALARADLPIAVVGDATRLDLPPGLAPRIETWEGLAWTDLERWSRDAPGTGPRFILGDGHDLALGGFGVVHRSAAESALNLKWLGISPDPIVRRQAAIDLALVRGLPTFLVAVPADAASAAAVVTTIADLDGPAYIRLAGQPLPVLPEVAWPVGGARELRAGGDLTVVAVGPPVHLGLEVADELHRVGVEVRVLDLGWVKPFDARAVLRAARETGAILTLEDDAAPTGLGTQVAAVVAENHPVPVRRVGRPDLWIEPGSAASAGAAVGVTRTRALEEAWELLRGKGKVQ